MRKYQVIRYNPVFYQKFYKIIQFVHVKLQLLIHNIYVPVLTLIYSEYVFLTNKFPNLSPLMFVKIYVGLDFNHYTFIAAFEFKVVK